MLAVTLELKRREAIPAFYPLVVVIILVVFMGCFAGNLSGVN